MSLLAQGTPENVGDGRELAISHLSQGHVVKELAMRQGKLLPDIPEVQGGLAALLLNLVLDVGQTQADCTVGLFTNDSDVPLSNKRCSAKTLSYRSRGSSGRI